MPSEKILSTTHHDQFSPNMKAIRPATSEKLHSQSERGGRTDGRTNERI